jgi:peptidoglycan/LPS O-acetylase OafA/YrhL
MPDQRPTKLPARNLDVLRATAVLCVLVSHLLAAWNVRLPGYGGEKMGRLGVLLFFVHTSLVLMSSLERQGVRREGWVWRFYLRRAFRIYPLAIVTVLLVVLCSIPEHIAIPAVAPTAVTLRTLVSNLALVQNLTVDPNVLGVLWSLPVEVQMYLLLPACFLVANRRLRDVILMLVAFCVVGLLVSRVEFRGVLRLSMLAYAPCFGAGVLAYHLLKRGIRPSLSAWTWPLVIAGVAALVYLFDPTFAHPEPGWIPCLLLGVAVPFVREANASIFTRLAQRVCEVSYGIYLLHEPVIWFSFVVLHAIPAVAQWLLFGVLIVALPTLAYRFIELPGIKLGQSLAHQRASRVVEVGAP